MGNTSRDNFLVKTVDVLSKRVCGCCSNPNCRRLTAGPNLDPNRYTNIGVAAHIYAAAPGGPRYNFLQTESQRRSIKNGIWLCQTCSVLIDRDELRYPPGLLFSWKENAELAAKQSLNNVSTNPYSDNEIILFVRNCIDRPALHSPFRYECNLIHFRQALDDTVSALSTGILLDRSGKLIEKCKGISYIRSERDRKKARVILDQVSHMRQQFDILVRQGKIIYSDDQATSIDNTIDQYFNSMRNGIYEDYNEIAENHNITKLDIY